MKSDLTVLFPRPPPTICRQCPAYSGPSTCRPSTSACTAGDCSPSEDKDRSSSSAAPPRYTCSLAQIHIMCLCCMQPMPDRSRTGSSSSSASPSDPVPTQKCKLVDKWKRVFSIQGCHGVLKIFKSLIFHFVFSKALKMS